MADDCVLEHREGGWSGNTWVCIRHSACGHVVLAEEMPDYEPTYVTIPIIR